MNSLAEKEIEKALVRTAKKMGGLALTFVSPGWDGAPDRIVLFPGGRIGFVELKRPGGTMRPLQIRRKKQLESLGFKVFCVDGTEKIPEALDEIKSQKKRMPE